MPTVLSTTTEPLVTTTSTYSPSYTPVTVYDPIYAPYDPFSYKTNVPIGIDHLIKKNYLKPIPYYDDASETITTYDDISTVISTEDEYGNIKNTIITQPMFTNPYDNTLITGWAPNYINPVISTFRDLNSDPVMRKKITKYFKSYMLNKLMKQEMPQILNYFTVDSNGNVSFALNNLDEHTYKRDTPSDIQKKINFLEKYIVTYDIINNILKKFIRTTGIQWVNLPAHKHRIKKLIEKKLIKLIHINFSTYF